MLTYARVKDFWLYLAKCKEYPEFTDLSLLWGDLKDYQRLFALDILLEMAPGSRIAEIGGGVCNVLVSLLKRFPEKYECWSIDPLEGQGGGPTSANLPKNLDKQINLIREAFGTFSRNIPNDYFDVLFSISVMEHIPLENWEDCFLDMVRVCRKGAVIFHTVDVPIDFDLADRRLNALKQLPEKVGLVLRNPDVSFEEHDARNDPSTYYVSPAAYARWLKHFPEGQNTLTTGIFKRVTAFNAVYKKP